MRQIINNPSEKCNKYFSSAAVVRVVTTPNELDSLYYRASLLPSFDSFKGVIRSLALLIYNDKMSGAIFSDRSLKQLALMFKCTRRHISRCLNHLKHVGYIVGKGRRWLTKMWSLTLEGFFRFAEIFPNAIYEPSKPSEVEMSTLETVDTNIDLFLDTKEKKILKEIHEIDLQLIGKATDKASLERCLKVFISTKSIQRHHRRAIYALFDRVNLPLERRYELFDRIVAYSLKNNIRAYYAYIKAAFIDAYEKFRAQLKLYELSLKLRKDFTLSRYAIWR